MSYIWLLAGKDGNLSWWSRKEWNGETLQQFIYPHKEDFSFIHNRRPRISPPRHLATSLSYFIDYLPVIPVHPGANTGRDNCRFSIPRPQDHPGRPHQ